MSERIFKIHPELEIRLQKILQDKFAIDILSPKFENSTECHRIAKAILQLSDYYISNSANIAKPTPWAETWCQLAYLAYYLVLNEVRVRAVLKEAQRQGFLKDIDQVIDFGSGLGSATFDLQYISNESTQFVHVEKSAVAQGLHKNFASDARKHRWTDLPALPGKNTLGIFSLSLNELENTPPWIYSFEKVLIMEPATSIQGRYLLELRKTFIEKNFSLWAPCTHQQACPLLEKSKHDWCHDRIHFEGPEWFQSIEKTLPIKNRTLTFSYLLAGKSPPPKTQGVARITGDFLDEKGKSRQLVCRGPEREYLTWMHKNLPKGTEPQVIPRGVLINWPKNFEEKSNEVRVTEPIEILKG